jgi:tetratricopeptide (TPR) repeat protein
MIRSTLLACSLVVAAHAAANAGTSADSLASIGQRAYAEGRYEEALNAFDSLAAGHRSASLCLALGNSHYKLGDVAHAILWYERGLRLAPNDDDLLTNLDLANEQIRDRIEADRPAGLGVSWRLLRGNDPDAWARYALFTCLLLFIALGIATMLKGWKRQLAHSLSALFTLALLTNLVVAWVSHRDLRSDQEAIIMVAKAEALAEPRDGAKPLFVLHRGAKVQAGPDADGWCSVQLPNGSTGWLRCASLERI